MDRTARVIVVGGGLAGLCAAIEASRGGANVIMVDKEPEVGGNSAKATSGINSCETDAQRKQGELDDPLQFEFDTVRSGKGQAEPCLVEVLVHSSTQALSWLETFGVQLDAVTRCGGHSVARTHRPAPGPDGRAVPAGRAITSALRQHLLERADAAGSGDAGGRVEVLTRCRVAELVTDGGRVVGVRVHRDGGCTAAEGKRGDAADAAAVEGKRGEAEGKHGEAEGKGGEETGAGAGAGAGSTELLLRADAVVLCTGGFASDHGPASLLREFAPHLAHLPTTNGHFATGDGVRLARAAGAELSLMDRVQVHPTAFVDPQQPRCPVKFLAPEALRGCGGLLLDAQGRRFANELAPRDALCKAMWRHCGGAEDSDISTDATPDAPAAAAKGPGTASGAAQEPVPAETEAVLIMNDTAVEAFGRGAVQFYMARGLMWEVADAAALANSLGVPAAQVAGTLEAYNEAARHGDPLGKPVFPVLFRADERLYVCRVTPALHYTMGGVAINSSAEVLRRDEADTLRPIPGLLAAGEVTGGVHGANRLAGNSLLECVVFGRIAGRRAAAYGVREEAALSSARWVPLRLRHWQALTEYIKIYSFELPSPLQRTGLALGQFLSVRAQLRGGGSESRVFPPLSRPDDCGHVDLLIKRDISGGGALTNHINELRPGDTLEFRGPMGGPTVNLDAVRAVGLVAGGVGIAPLVQVVRAALMRHARAAAGEPVRAPSVSLVFGAAREEELLFREQLRRQARHCPALSVHFALNVPPAGWDGSVGLITADILREQLPPPAPDTLVMLSGPPAMCKALKPVLAALGYTGDMLYSYV